MSTEADDVPHYLTEERRLQRRKLLEPIVVRARGSALTRRACFDASLWTDKELATLLPWAEKVKKKEMSYYRACREAMPVLNRSSEAIRKKLKNWVNYGNWGLAHR